MRYCDVEGADFPNAEFERRDGVWYHKPQDGEAHLVEAETEVTAREGPGKMPPDAAPPPMGLDAE